jgi:hypothetical protein
VTNACEYGPIAAQYDGVGFPRWARRFFIISALIRLWLAGGQTLHAIGWAGHDDRLFLNLANQFLTHGWLGHYSNLTLIKGPFYPFWIALNFVLGVPLLLSQHLFYIAACAIFVVAVRPLFAKQTLLLVVWCVLLFNPMSYTDQVMTRVTRGGVYPALTILVVALAGGLLARRDLSLKRLKLWSAGLGVALAAFWLTREEGVWIIPSILMITGLTAVKIFRTKPFDHRRLFVACALPFCIWAVIVGAVAGINKVAYGVFATVEVKSRDFLDAYGALSRIRHEHWQRYVPVPKEVRERVYKVSNAFAELKPFLEGSIGEGWKTSSCKGASVCDDIGGGWFMWALRDCVAAAGYYSSGSSASNYYRRVAREVNAACADKSLDCGPERSSLMPPWRSEYEMPLLNTMAKAGVGLVRFDGFWPYPTSSEGPEDQLLLTRDLTRDRLSPSTAAGRFPKQAKFDDIKITILAYIGKIYQIAGPFAVSLALIIYIIGTVCSIRKRAVTELWMISAALLVAIFIRVLILSMIHVTSFPAIRPGYGAPAYPLLLLFVSLSFAGCRMYLKH